MKTVVTLQWRCQCYVCMAPLMLMWAAGNGPVDRARIEKGLRAQAARCCYGA